MNFIPLYPEFVMGVGAFIVFLLGLVIQSSKMLAGIAAIITAIALALIVLNFSITMHIVSTLRITQYSNLFNILFLISLLLTLSASVSESKRRPEIFYALLLFSTLGMMFVSFSNNLLMIFVAFEASSIATYAVSAYNKERKSVEAALKYFVIGALSSAILIFGMSYLYLASGSLDFSKIALVSNKYSIIGLVLVIVGFGFKLALFPFHSWAIDTYTGTKASISAFLATGSKLMAFIALLKLTLFAFTAMKYDVYVIFAILSVLTMTFGNVAALVQHDVKRMLAYSSIANAGYLSLIFVILGFSHSSLIMEYGLAAVLLFSVAYIFMKAGTFISTGPFEHGDTSLESFAGLGKKAPVFAFSVLLLLLSLAGIPPTIGFTGKYYLFLALIESHILWLAIIAILNSAISVFYYFRVIMYMYWKSGTASFYSTRNTTIPVVVAAILVIVLGITSPFIIGFFHSVAVQFLGGI